MISEGRHPAHLHEKESKNLERGNGKILKKRPKIRKREKKRIGQKLHFIIKLANLLNLFTTDVSKESL